MPRSSNTSTAPDPTPETTSTRTAIATVRQTLKHPLPKEKSKSAANHFLWKGIWRETCRYVKCYWYDEYDTPSPTDTRTVRNYSYIRRLIRSIIRPPPPPPPLPSPATYGTYWYLLPTSICLEGSTRRGRYIKTNNIKEKRIRDTRHETRNTRHETRVTK